MAYFYKYINIILLLQIQIKGLLNFNNIVMEILMLHLD